MDNLNEIKILTEDDLKQFLPVNFRFKTKPMPHQLSSLVAALYADFRIILELGLGTGKTKVTIDAFKMIRALKNPNARAFVICLNSAVEVWGEEIEKHSNFSYTLLRGGTSSDKLSLLKRSETDFVIVNYESFLFMLTDRSMLTKAEKEFMPKSKCGLQKSKDKIDDFKNMQFSTLIIDESHQIKNSQSKTFKVLRTLFPYIPFKILLTGTPFGKNLSDIWSQYLVVDGGKTFYNTLGLFRSTYCEEKGNFWGKKWEVSKSGAVEIKKKMFRKAIVYTEEEIGGLPEKVFRVIKYELSTKQKKDYLRLREKKKAQDLREIISNRGIAFRMICSGFIGKDAPIIYKDNPKLEALKDLVEEGIERHKFVIFAEFRKSSELICEMFKKLKIKYCRLDGTIADKITPQRLFQQNDSYRAIVVNSKSGSASINLFAGTVCVFYENNGSIIVRKQSEKRIHRTGQTRRCYFYDLVGKGTIETSIYNNIKNGIDVFNEIMNPKDLDDILTGKR